MIRQDVKLQANNIAHVKPRQMKPNVLYKISGRPHKNTANLTGSCARAIRELLRRCHYYLKVVCSCCNRHPETWQAGEYSLGWCSPLYYVTYAALCRPLVWVAFLLHGQFVSICSCSPVIACSSVTLRFPHCAKRQVRLDFKRQARCLGNQERFHCQLRDVVPETKKAYIINTSPHELHVENVTRMKVSTI